MEAQITWHHGLNFTGRADSGTPVQLGAEGEGLRPMQLFALGLAGCTAMDVISLLEKKRQQITDFKVEIDLDRAEEHPKVFTYGRIHYLVSGRNVDEAAVLRAIELSATRYCPAQAMFAHVIPMEMDYSIFEDQGGGNFTLVKHGVYQPEQPAVSG